jgi:hypothetical protein
VYRQRGNIMSTDNSNVFNPDAINKAVEMASKMSEPQEMKQSKAESEPDFGKLKSQPDLSFGQKLVGLTFNPSGDEKVNKAKQLCADLADLIYQDRQSRETTQLESILYPHTIGEILNAQMNVVKLLTLKY